MKVFTKPQRCKQCGLCVANCPKQAISFAQEINKNGYNYTVVDHEKCIKCGICYTVCPDGVYTIAENVQEV
ncbi:MAG: 4Fe-4S binding protein [Peptostreptococcaceae bacterium]|nr:4Fe-4S binding protein [Peptostreptococcaceae bacterium]